MARWTDLSRELRFIWFGSRLTRQREHRWTVGQWTWKHFWQVGLISTNIGSMFEIHWRGQTPDCTDCTRCTRHQLWSLPCWTESTNTKKMENDKMLCTNVIEPAQLELTSVIVFATKRVQSLLSCTDHRNLNAVTAKDSYPILRMDECLYSLDEERISPTLGASYSYLQIEINDWDTNRATSTLHRRL